MAVSNLERLVTVSALLQNVPAADQRSSPRRKLCLGSSLQTSGDAVTILDFSATGMLIETAAELLPFDSLQIDLPEVGFQQAVIIWNSGRYYGCEFRERVPQAAISAALLRSPPAKLDTLAPPPLRPSNPSTGLEASPVEDAAEEKAPLTTRLRLILGSAIALWAIIIWAIRSLIS
jgi:hypothetical protein